MKKTAQCGGFFHFILGGYLLEAEILSFIPLYESGFSR